MELLLILLTFCNYLCLVTSASISPPSTWKEYIDSGNMVWSGRYQHQLQSGIFPMLGNGNLGLIVGSREWLKDEWPHRDSGTTTVNPNNLNNPLTFELMCFKVISNWRECITVTATDPITPSPPIGLKFPLSWTC